MPSAASTSDAPASRLPAWKRLGLQLKSAKETPIVESHKEIEPSAKKRKLETNGTPPAKKVKKIKATAGTGPTTPALNRKKSVTFTPETKVEDGDSIKQLFSSWVAEQKAQDPAFQAKTTTKVFDTPEPTKVQEHFDTTLDEKERRVKRVEKPRSEEKGKSKDTPKRKPRTPKIVKSTITTTRPFLVYLRQYHEDRDNWKFNKNHQNHILKNLFDIHSIPSEYVPLIYEYIKGLQGGVRTRLRDAALAIKVKDQEEGVAVFAKEMSRSSAQELEKRQREYEECCKEYAATMTAANAPKEMGYEEGVLQGLSDAAMKTRVAKRTRAEMVLAEMGAGTTAAEAEKRATPRDSDLTFREEGDSQKRVRTDDDSEQKVARKRKQRTANVEESSSSDDSSDSDDSDSSSDCPENDGQIKPSKGASSSSSSGSSDSGSDSDDSGDSDTN